MVFFFVVVFLDVERFETVDLHTFKQLRLLLYVSCRPNRLNLHYSRHPLKLYQGH